MRNLASTKLTAGFPYRFWMFALGCQNGHPFWGLFFSGSFGGTGVSIERGQDSYRVVAFIVPWTQFFKDLTHKLEDLEGLLKRGQLGSRYMLSILVLFPILLISYNMIIAWWQCLTENPKDGGHGSGYSSRTWCQDEAGRLWSKCVGQWRVISHLQVELYGCFQK